MNHLNRILTQTFGHKSFRGRQREIVERLLAGKHALVIMPTGMGKSLCYQLPAVVFAQQTKPNTIHRFITVVLSPLIALMKDQVDALNAKGISATFVNSSLQRRERLDRYDAIKSGQYDLLYVTPERFRKMEFREVLATRDVSLLAIDEAHCISEWGHDFRPDYTRVGEIRGLLGNPTTIALTATATPDVQADIVRQLGIDCEEIKTFHEGIERPNLSLDVEHVIDDDEKVRLILATKKRHAGSGIVYFTLIRKLLEFSDQLTQAKIAHLIYHGELPRNQRRQIQDTFMNEDGHLVLATNAFGMGVDKDSIRCVLHADMPGSLESYYQEIGRAGRDGKPSACLLMYDERDLATQMEFLRWSNPDAGYYERLYDLLSKDLEKANAFGLEWVREKLHFKERHDRRLEAALLMLERWGVVTGSFSNSNVEIAAELPNELTDNVRLAEKLYRDQQKLWAMLQYAKHAGDRREYIHQYFGLPSVE